MEVKIFRQLLRTLGEYQLRHPVGVLLAVVVFTALLVPGLFMVYFDTSNENFLPEGDPVVEDLFVVGSEFSALSSMEILFLSDAPSPKSAVDLRDPVFLARADRIALSIREIGYIDDVDSPTFLLKAANDGILPTDLEDVKALLAANPRIAGYFTNDYSAMKMTLTAGDFGSDAVSSERIVRELDAHVESVPLPEGIRAKIWGNDLQFIELDRNLAQSMGLTTFLGFAIIFLLVLAFYRSWIVAVFSIIPIIVSLVWTIATMGYIGLPFTVLTSGFIPLVMGLGIDYAIHITHSTRVLTREGHSLENAILETMDDIGESIFASTLTTVIGFLSLLLASLLITQRLGLTLALSVFYIFIGTIVMLPPILIIQQRGLRNASARNETKR